MNEFETTIDGIPCIVRYSISGMEMPATREEPPEYEDLEYQILDRKGYPAPWLESKMTSSDELRISDECFDHRESSSLSYL